MREGGGEKWDLGTCSTTSGPPGAHLSSHSLIHVTRAFEAGDVLKRWKVPQSQAASNQPLCSQDKNPSWCNEVSVSPLHPFTSWQ